MNVIKDMVSVIVPAYNRDSVIKECIGSVVAQSYQNFEIIIIDDGSCDKTLEVCQSLSDEEPRIKLFSMNHEGVSAARNKGLENASGKYLFFLDSDDVIHPLLLESLVVGMKNSNASIAGTGIASVNEKYWYKVRERLQQPSNPGETTYHTNEEVLDAVFHGSTPLNLIGGVMMHRSLVGNTRFRADLFIGEDFYFIYENLIKGAPAVFLKQKWYYARHHANNSSWNYTFDGFYTRFRRRELVWNSEEAFGRVENANREKESALGCFIRCLRKNKACGEEAKKMREFMRKHKKILVPALKPVKRVLYYLSVYAPISYPLMFATIDLRKSLKGHIAQKNKKYSRN